MKAWNSTLKPGTKVMKRSGFKRHAPAENKAALKSGKKRLRASRPKTTPIRASAKGEECTIELHMVCNHNPETVVWCHENSYDAGKGMGLKARDERGAYGCSDCHAVYDGQVPRPAWMTKEYVDERFALAMERSGEILKRKGLLRSGE
jgi:hypothetical protein